MSKVKVDNNVKEALEKAALDSLSIAKERKVNSKKVVTANETPINANDESDIDATENSNLENTVDDTSIINFDFTDEEEASIQNKKDEVVNEVIEEVLENETSNGPVTYNFLGIDITVDKNPGADNYLITLSNDGVTDTREIAGNSIQEIMDTVNDYLATFELSQDNPVEAEQNEVGEENKMLENNTENIETTETPVEAPVVEACDVAPVPTKVVTADTEQIDVEEVTEPGMVDVVPPATEDVPVDTTVETPELETNEVQTIAEVKLNLTGTESTPEEIANAITVEVFPDMAVDSEEGFYSEPEQGEDDLLPEEVDEEMEVNDEVLGGVYGLQSGTCYYKGKYNKCTLIANAMNKKSGVSPDPKESKWASVYRKNKETLMAHAKLGYGFKKFILESNKGELFKSNIKEYVERNKELDKEIIMSKKMINDKDKPKYLLAKKMNEDLKTKHKAIEDTIEKIHKVLVAGNCSHEHIKSILASVSRSINAPVDKFKVIISKTNNVIDKISLNAKKELNNIKPVLASNVSNKNHDAKKTAIVAKKSNLVIDERIPSKVSNRYDGTDEMLNEILGI